MDRLHDRQGPTWERGRARRAGRRIIKGKQERELTRISAKLAPFLPTLSFAQKNEIILAKLSDDVFYSAAYVPTDGARVWVRRVGDQDFPKCTESVPVMATQHTQPRSRALGATKRKCRIRQLTHWFVGYHPRGPLSRGSPAETRRTYPRLAASRRLVRAFATVVALAHRKPVMAKPVMANPLIVVVAALLCILCVLR